MDLSPRKFLLKKEFAEYLDMDGYVNAAYARSLAQTPRLPEDTPEEARRREFLAEPDLVHADPFKPHGPDQHVLRPGGPGSLRGSPDY